MSDDKYPSESGRRRFVKGVVGSAALTGVGGAGTATIGLATQPTGGGGGETPFVGLTLLPESPAPRGMPYIPLELDDEGYFEGVWPEPETITTDDGRTFDVARMEIGGRTYSSEWFQYCGRQKAEGVQPTAEQNNYFLSHPETPYDWQREALDEGDRLHVDHFSDYETWGNGLGDDGVGKPAEVNWRSEGTDGQLPVTLIRSTRVEEQARRDDEVGQWFSAASVAGTIAYLNVCTHFCCVPGYKESGQSAQYDAENGVYCQCHQSTYDPFEPEFGTFTALPRPD